MEHDLIQLGLRLRWVGDGSGRVSWRDVIVIIRNAGQGTAIARHVHGEAAEWGAAEYLLAAAVDALNAANWQRSGDKHAKKPTPIPLPGVESHSRRETPVRGGEAPAKPSSKPSGDPFDANQSGVFRGEAMPIDELNKFLGWA